MRTREAVRSALRSALPSRKKVPPFPGRSGPQVLLHVMADLAALTDELVHPDREILDGRLLPESRQKEYGRPPRKLERSPGHHQEWINACKGGKPAGSNFPDHAGMLAQVVLLGNVSLRPPLKEPKVFGTKLLFDAKEFKFTNMPEANKYLTKEYRQGWEL